jgi:predicted transcriptional regulator
MGTDRIDDIPAFRVFLDEQLASGGAFLTPAEALALWEHRNASDKERETVEAIQRGFEDIDAGRVRPAGEAVAELSRKQNLAQEPVQ